MGDLVLRGGRALLDGAWVEQDLHVRDGRIAPPSAGPDEPGPAPAVLDVTGLLVAPGYVDLQCNGAVGIDVTRAPGGLWDVAAALPAWGVTAWLPTVVTAPPGAVEAALEALAAGPPAGWVGAMPLGLHLEGPFLARAARGAHAAEHLRPPTPAAVAGWRPAAGVRLVTLAPELPGALATIEALAADGVVVALGHSRATAEEARAGVDAGASFVTHLFNAMAPLHHREPGLAGVALEDERVRVGLIADGVHVAPPMVRLAQRLLGDRLTLVTDGVAPMGTGPAEAVDALRTADGVLAGATVPMAPAVARLARSTGCDPAAAVAAATAAPAAVLGDGTRGTLAPGARGDLVVLTPELDLVATVVGGRVVHGPQHLSAA